MHIIKNDRLLRAMLRQPVDRTPLWIMRQAGRYLPEYRKLRQEAGSFLQLCRAPELACEVTLQPLKRFPFDAAILFSDILIIPDALGLGLHFVEGEGPRFLRPVRTAKAVEQLPELNHEESLSYVYAAIRLIKQALAGSVPLIGFCGSPWTVATYMVEGCANKAFPRIQKMLQKEPKTLHQLLKKLAIATSEHLNAQIRAGVDVVMVFDTWGGMLSTNNYVEFSLAYIKEIFQSLQMTEKTIPKVLFTKNGGQWMHLMAASGCDVIGLDWRTSLHQVRIATKGKIALQGNMNPAMLYESDAQICHEVSRILHDYGLGSGHIFNLGHGIAPDVNPDKVAVLVDAVHRLSVSFHN